MVLNKIYKFYLIALNKNSCFHSGIPTIQPLRGDIKKGGDVVKTSPPELLEYTNYLN